MEISDHSKTEGSFKPSIDVAELESFATDSEPKGVEVSPLSDNELDDLVFVTLASLKIWGSFTMPVRRVMGDLLKIL